jgi:hypothetical protein
MAYNNTNRDKLQDNWMEGLKRVVIAMSLLAILISSGVSIYQQWSSLRDARERNKIMENEMKKLKKDNFDLKRRIEYATSSAGLARKKVGNDFELVMPKPDIKITDSIEEKEVIKPYVIQWWEMFTK